MPHHDAPPPALLLRSLPSPPGPASPCPAAPLIPRFPPPAFCVIPPKAQEGNLPVGDPGAASRLQIGNNTLGPLEGWGQGWQHSPPPQSRSPSPPQPPYPCLSTGPHPLELGAQKSQSQGWEGQGHPSGAPMGGAQRAGCPAQGGREGPWAQGQ
ncbi:6-phosphogluconolactonase [Platysternon megacephalum]|uniref:6-phosphogluconolactonase n=1 Tax=Platysternon megacephalum TaxID=55544 RepID=A0A4D9DKT0_9SAUR|nr:6-phosphogluconolactonase [Platysternon megacephalum]